jgi:hypothetical protein
VSTINRWAINESLLQSYRSMFISSQAFLLAVGAIVIGKSSALVYVTAAVGILVTWSIWFPVVRARHRIVDYYKYSTNLSDDDRAQLCSEHDYVHDAERRARANQLFGITTNWRRTRLKMDIGLPLLFSSIWVALVVYECSRT